jgi:glycosyltransferase involved in cell wall biosynthesis
MKIIHLGNVPPPLDHPQREIMASAIHPGRWVLNHAIAQKRAGMDIEVITQAHKATCDFVCEIEGVKVHFLRTYHPYRNFTFYAVDQLRMASYVKKLRPDIVHAHGTEAAYSLAALRTGLPFCVTAQGLMFQIIPALKNKVAWGLRFIRISEHYVLKRTKYVIAKSEYVREALAKEYPHLDLTLIPNTYQPELESELKPRTGKKLVFVGSVDHRKGVHLIADAMGEVVKQHPEVELHIAGNQPEGTGDEYAIEQIAKLRKVLGDQLVLHGKISALELFDLLDQCQALLAPSLEEMFGNQLIEGLMRGCHGIVGEGTALAENVRRFGNGTVVPSNHSVALAESIRACLTQPAAVAKQEGARVKIRSYMSPNIVASSHNSFYQKISL